MVVLYHSLKWNDIYYCQRPKLILFSKIITLNFNGGYLGVTFFFVLSGFLITYLLINENEKFGYINIKFFYIRRLLRIWPIYYITIIIGFFILPFIFNYLNIDYLNKANIYLYSFFLTNFDHIYNLNNIPSPVLGVQWSVAVEEQFYLIWPVFVIIFINRKFLLISSFLFLFSIFTTLYCDPKFIYFHTLSALRFLSLGGIFAYLCFYKNSYIIRTFDYLSLWIIYLIYILFLIVVYTNGFNFTFIQNNFPMLFFVFIILDQIYNNKNPLKFSKIPFLTYTGKISYGMYLFHMIPIFLLLQIYPGYNNIIIKVLLSFLITFILSYLSYNYFEKPFLKYKNKFYS